MKTTINNHALQSWVAGVGLVMKGTLRASSPLPANSVRHLLGKESGGDLHSRENGVLGWFSYMPPLYYHSQLEG